MERNYLLAIDQGTTGSTVLVVDASSRDQLEIIARATCDFPQHYPQPGWVEHNLEQVWQSVLTALKKALELASAGASNFTPNRIAAIGITNQRETLCFFDGKTGSPARNAIVWQCRRSHEICQRLRKENLQSIYRNKTGLVLDPYFSGTKASWVIENEPELGKKIKDGQIYLGTIDTFLLHRLTGAQVYATEPSNASRTLWFDIDQARFSPELWGPLGLTEKTRLPEVKDSAGIFGKTKGVAGLPDGIPISGILGDQQAALAGQACFAEGDAKCTYGTGAFLLLNTGSRKLISSSGLITTVAWSLKGSKTYAFEGSSFIAGAAIQFLRDQFTFMKHAKDSEKMAKDAKAAPLVYFVPALAGLGAPHWNAKARGAFLGLSRDTTKGQLVRAALEGISFEVYDLVQSMLEDFPQPLTSLNVDGGAAANDLLMQMQADYLNITVDRPKNLETTAFGAALFAGLGVGIFSDLAQTSAARKSEKMFTPTLEKSQSQSHINGWRRAVSAVQTFANDDG